VGVAVGLWGWGALFAIDEERFVRLNFVGFIRQSGRPYPYRAADRATSRPLLLLLLVGGGEVGEGLGSRVTSSPARQCPAQGRRGFADIAGLSQEPPLPEVELAKSPRAAVGRHLTKAPQPCRHGKRPVQEGEAERSLIRGRKSVGEVLRV